jgi:hypothetical protein
MYFPLHKNRTRELELGPAISDAAQRTLEKETRNDVVAPANLDHLPQSTDRTLYQGKAHWYFVEHKRQAKA